MSKPVLLKTIAEIQTGPGHRIDVSIATCGKRPFLNLQVAMLDERGVWQARGFGSDGLRVWHHVVWEVDAAIRMGAAELDQLERERGQP